MYNFLLLFNIYNRLGIFNKNTTDFGAKNSKFRVFRIFLSSEMGKFCLRRTKVTKRLQKTLGKFDIDYNSYDMLKCQGC